jgi:hypothetical protein
VGFLRIYIGTLTGIPERVNDFDVLEYEDLLAFGKGRLSKKIVVEYFLWQIEVWGLKYNEC